MKPLPRLIPKLMTQIGEEITTLFRENFRDFRQWVDKNFTQVNEGNDYYQQSVYFPTPKWKPDTLYLTLKRSSMNVDRTRDEWSPDELIYIRYNPVYGRSCEPQEEGQYDVNVEVWRCRFQRGENAFFPVWSRWYQCPCQKGRISESKYVGQ